VNKVGVLRGISDITNFNSSSGNVFPSLLVIPGKIKKLYTFLLVLLFCCVTALSLVIIFVGRGFSPTEIPPGIKKLLTGVQLFFCENL
jgi:hypothetical protein